MLCCLLCIRVLFPIIFQLYTFTNPVSIKLSLFSLSSFFHIIHRQRSVGFFSDFLFIPLICCFRSNFYLPSLLNFRVNVVNFTFLFEELINCFLVSLFSFLTKYSPSRYPFEANKYNTLFSHQTLYNSKVLEYVVHLFFVHSN